jgi:ZIP family zinc transporter
MGLIMTEFLSQFNIQTIGILATVLTGLATFVGAIPILFTRKISNKLMDGALGIAAGIMLAATSFSLIIPAIESGGGGLRGAAIALIGILIGGIFIDVTDRLLPNTNMMSNSMSENTQYDMRSLRRIWIFIAAITIHNLPEGLAVGVGFASGNIHNGITLTIGIGLQNLPEGLAVALPLMKAKFPKWKALLIAFISGLAEPIGGLLGVTISNLSTTVLPIAMSFAAGAMLFVISHEIIPETQKDKNTSKFATHCVIVGFVIMMFLDNVL